MTTPVMMEEDRNVQLGDEICSWESMKMDASSLKVDLERDPGTRQKSIG